MAIAFNNVLTMYRYDILQFACDDLTAFASRLITGDKFQEWAELYDWFQYWQIPEPTGISVFWSRQLSATNRWI
jgi:hypothetical protein